MAVDPAVPYAARRDGQIDLSAFDFEALREQFDTGRRRMQAERLQGQIKEKVLAMCLLNRSRMNYLEKFQEMIEAYNLGARNVEAFFQQMLDFLGGLRREERRGEREGLSEEELAVYDLLTQQTVELSGMEPQLKNIARDLLEALKKDRLTLDWRKRQQAKARVRVTIEKLLDERLPESYDKAMFEAVCSAIYAHVYEAYPNVETSIYERYSVAG